MNALNLIRKQLLLPPQLLKSRKKVPNELVVVFHEGVSKNIDLFTQLRTRTLPIGRLQLRPMRLDRIYIHNESNIAEHLFLRQDGDIVLNISLDLSEVTFAPGYFKEDCHEILISDLGNHRFTRT